MKRWTFKLGFSWWSLLELERAAVLAETLLALFNKDPFTGVQEKLFHLVFQNWTFLLNMFKSFMVRFERGQKASDVSASYAGLSRLEWWTVEQTSRWSFTAQTFTHVEDWSKLLQYVVGNKSFHAFKNQLDEFMERKSMPSMNCGDTKHGESGSWDAISRKYHSFLCLTDYWWTCGTGPNVAFLTFSWNMYFAIGVIMCQCVQADHFSSGGFWRLLFLHFGRLMVYCKTQLFTWGFLDHEDLRPILLWSCAAKQPKAAEGLERWKRPSGKQIFKPWAFAKESWWLPSALRSENRLSAKCFYFATLFQLYLLHVTFWVVNFKKEETCCGVDGMQCVLTKWDGCSGGSPFQFVFLRFSFGISLLRRQTLLYGFIYIYVCVCTIPKLWCLASLCFSIARIYSV